jgi:hypothetical protein
MQMRSGTARGNVLMEILAMDDRTIERTAGALAWVVVVGFCLFFAVATLRNWNYL